MGLIVTADIPRLSDCEYDLIRQQGDQLRAVGKEVSATGSGVATTYRTLYNVYVAPEAEQLVTSIDPVLKDSTEFGNNMVTLGDALHGFADEIEPINERLIELVNRSIDLHYKITKCKLNGQAIHREQQKSSNPLDFLAPVFDEIVMPAVSIGMGRYSHTTKQFASDKYPEGAILVGTNWDGYSDLVSENNSISGEVRQLASQFYEIQFRYANKIAELCGGRKWNAETGGPDGWELPPPVDEFGRPIRRIGPPPPPSWAEDAEWDRPLGMDIVLAPGELLLETLDFVTTISGLQALARSGLDLAGLGDTGVAQGLATWKETGEAWVNLAKTVGAIAGALASVNPITDAGFKAVVGEETAQELHQFGVEWANGMVEDWKRNPAKAVLGVAVSVVPIGGALTAVRVAGMASRIKPVAAVARGAQKVVDLKAAAIGKTLDALKLPRVSDILGGKAKIPVVEMPPHVGVDPRGVNIGRPDGRPGVDRIEVPTVPGRHGEGLPVTHERPFERPVERPIERPVERPVERPSDRPVERPAERPVTPPADRPSDRPADHPADRPAARSGDREQTPVTPVTHPVDRPVTPVGDRSGTSTSQGDRSGTSTSQGDRTGTSTSQGDRTGTSTGRDREPDRTAEPHDREPGSADRRTEQETRRPVDRRDERGRPETPTRHETPTRQEPDSGRVAEPTRTGTQEVPPYVPPVHPVHGGGGDTTHDSRTAARAKDSAPDFRGSDADRSAFREKHPITDFDRRQLDEIRRRQPEGVNLHDEELLAINRLMDRDHMEVNEAHRNRDQEALDRFGPLIRNGVSGLNKVPDYRGMVHRGIQIDAADLDDFLRRYEPGRTVREPGFTSSDKHGGFPGNVQFHIESRFGKDISFVRDPHGGNKEVVHSPDNHFGVERRYHDADTDTWHIHLTDKGRSPDLDLPDRPARESPRGRPEAADPDSDIARRLRGEPARQRLDGDTDPNRVSGDRVSGDRVEGDRVEGEGLEPPGRRPAPDGESEISRRLAGEPASSKHEPQTPSGRDGDADADDAQGSDGSEQPADGEPRTLDPSEIAPPRTAADGPELPTKERLPQFEGEEKGEWMPGRRVEYLDAEAREELRLVVHEGRLYRVDGRPFDTANVASAWTGEGNAIFVMDRYGNIYAGPQEVGKFHHSSFLSGDPVAGAGELGVVNGKLRYISDKSGHYQPLPPYLERVIERLKEEGVDFDDVERGSW